MERKTSTSRIILESGLEDIKIAYVCSEPRTRDTGLLGECLYYQDDHLQAWFLVYTMHRQPLYQPQLSYTPAFKHAWEQTLHDTPLQAFPELHDLSHLQSQASLICWKQKNSMHAGPLHCPLALGQHILPSSTRPFFNADHTDPHDALYWVERLMRLSNYTDTGITALMHMIKYSYPSEPVPPDLMHTIQQLLSGQPLALRKFLQEAERYLY